MLSSLAKDIESGLASALAWAPVTSSRLLIRKIALVGQRLEALEIDRQRMDARPARRQAPEASPKRRREAAPSPRTVRIGG